MLHNFWKQSRLSNNIDKGEQQDIIYLDFQKAFDPVSHKLLISKLEAYGFHSQIVNCIKGFLENQKQRVTIGQSKSNWSNILSDVQQGSVFGPVLLVLFLIFINDMPNVVRTVIKLFADDAKLLGKLNESDRKTDYKMT